MDELDVVSLKEQYDIPKFAGRDDRVKKALLEEIGVDINDPEFKLENYKEKLTEEQDLKLSRLANQARQTFNQAKSGVQLPEKVDYKQKINERLQQRQQRVEQLNKTWHETARGIAESASQVKFVDKNDKGEVVDEFIYDVDAEFKQNIPDIINQYAVSNNVEPTPENVKAVTELLMNAYKVANWDKMLRSARNEARTQVREQLDKERFNGQPINKTEAPPDRKPDENDEINLIAGRLFK
jgi:predicted nuclease with TOPRIM domain